MGTVIQQDDVISGFTMSVLDLGKQHALSPKYYRNKQCNQYDNEYALGFLTTLNSKAER
jgi:hypothetical protein